MCPFGQGTEIKIYPENVETSLLLNLYIYIFHDQMSILNQVNCKTFFRTLSIHRRVCELGTVDCQPKPILDRTRWSDTNRVQKFGSLLRGYLKIVLWSGLTRYTNSNHRLLKRGRGSNTCVLSHSFAARKTFIICDITYFKL